MPADRGRYPPPVVALPSPPAACLVPGLPLPQAHRSREITPPDRCCLNARRPVSVSKPTGSALIHARWPPLSLAPWIKSTCHGQEARMASMATTRGAACPRRVSMDKTRQDMVVKMFLWARQNRHKALLAPLLLKWRRSLRDPVRAPDTWSCPEEASASELAQEGFWFLWDVLSCLSGPGGLSCRRVLSCPVCLALEGCPVVFCTVLSV